MDESQEKKPKNMHEGHRGRMRGKYMNAGPEAFPDHELLETLLYFSIRQQNTNEIAHMLLSYFGSLEAIVNADATELCAVSGIGENSAWLFNLIGEVYRRIARSRCEMPKSYHNTEQIIQYLQYQYIGVPIEKIYLLLFNNRMKMLKVICVDEGTVNRARIDPAVIVKHAILHNASAALLAHNHPDGVAIPSSDDIQTTYQLQSLLASLNITLLDHLIFAGERYTSILLHAQQQEPTLVANHFYESYLKDHDPEAYQLHQSKKS